MLGLYHTLLRLFLFAHHALAGSQLPLCFVAFWYALVISSSVQRSVLNMLCIIIKGRSTSLAVIVTCSPYCSLGLPVTVKLKPLRSGFLNGIGDVYSCINTLYQCKGVTLSPPVDKQKTALGGHCCMVTLVISLVQPSIPSKYQ